ncbi:MULTISPECIES: FAD/NAD(P)-binding protein [unclassified Amycolatopsis]|uniref:FAD/NAD(P)-binding protein n=1 Tax=unclassified Amycolatopsis TaxID=2618356 RepID=UPI002876CF9C|nr:MULTISPECIES: FAD/NAD(P)-binding protein [unclassified Amycolatopsis]MDS0140097.1 FAD/NAD(P)-binding protein [Amycolatopsis sp. 505]MDS0148651.1 FAD/NAD(P)-binding protein [Amycolatopsis sp. CM201R]
MWLSNRFRRVVIVGAGLGGTATAVRLLQFAREPLQLVLIERHPEYRSAGVAYHRAGNHWHHVFNIQAGRMSMFREDVDDFVAWANSEADRTGWPPEWSGFTFTESGPAPRRIYADYLADRLVQAACEATDGVTLVEADGEVVDVEVDGGHAHVVVDRFSVIRNDSDTAPDRVTLRADHVVIATGLEERDLPFAADVMNHPSFVRHPYSEEGIARILGIGQDATVAIIGTLLTAYDSAALLLRRGHTGKIAMISRSGRVLRTYPPDHRHRVLDLPAPRLHSDSYEGRGGLLQRVTAEWERACAIVAREHPEVAPVVVSERVAKSWEPYLPEVLARIPSADLRALLDEYGTLLAALRVGAVAYTTEIVDAAMDDGGPITLITGKVDRIVGTEAGTLMLSVAGSSSTQTLEADLVISNFGREPDYGRVGSALWAALLRKKIAVRHRRTGRGVEVDGSGALLGPSGVASGPISVIGGPREGDEIVRLGRIGAFTFNLAAIKNHSVGVAATLLRRLESCYDEHAEDLAETLTEDLGVRKAFAASVMLDVRRMTARRSRDREALATRLEASLAGIRDATSDSEAPWTDRALRSAVNTAAMRKLNDLSVTPRELRGLLGLDEPLESLG